ncbi:hypothetical protein D9M71_278870 [compost metagenome]
MKDFSFQGKFHLGRRLATGKPGALQWVDDASELSIALSMDQEERQESWSGQRLTSVILPKAKKATFVLTLNAASSENLALALQAQLTKVPTGSVTGELLPPDLVAGDLIALDHPRMSALTLTDSKPTPTPLALGTHYQIESAAASMIKLLDPAALVQPFKAAYTHDAYHNLAAFKIGRPERYGILDGINTVDDERVRVLIYRMSFDPVENLALITDGLGNLKLKGSILLDQINFPKANLGGFAAVQKAED